MISERGVGLQGFKVCGTPRCLCQDDIWCNGGCKQWYHDTCENIDKDVWNSKKRSGTVKTVKSNFVSLIFTDVVFHYSTH